MVYNDTVERQYHIFHRTNERSTQNQNFLPTTVLLSTYRIAVSKKNFARDKKKKREMAEKGFDPEKSKIGTEALMRFLSGEVQEDILSVPGIGSVAADKLREDVEGDSGIETTYQLIGKFLLLKGKGMSAKQVRYLVTLLSHVIVRTQSF